MDKILEQVIKTQKEIMKTLDEKIKTSFSSEDCNHDCENCEQPCYYSLSDLEEFKNQEIRELNSKS